MGFSKIQMGAVSSPRLFSHRKIGRFAATVVVCGLIAANPLRTLAQTSPNSGVPNYRDPQGRYTLRIPQGWSASQMNSDAVQVSSGTAYVTMVVVASTDTALMISSTAASIGKQWKNFAEMRRGTANFGGRTGQFVTYSGVNPKGSDSYLQMLASTDGSLTYLLMTSAPKADFNRLKSAFDQIEQSFAITHSAKGLESSVPIPAGALESSSSLRTPPQPPAPPRPPSSSPPPAAPPPARPPAPPGPGSKSTAPGGANVYRMKLVRIVDERGFERPMTALTLLIPTDWQFQGSVQYGPGPGCHANLVRLVFRASSPDGRLSIELFPGNAWQWTDDLNMRNMMQASNQQMAQYGVHGCEIMAPMSADAYLRRRVLPGVRRDARVAGSEPMPEAAERLQEEAVWLQQIAAKAGIRVNLRSDVSRVRVSYVLGGAPVEEWFTAMTSSAAMPGPSFNIRTGQAGQVLYYTNSADHVFSMRAPQGQLDGQEKFFQLIMGTVHVDPQWQDRVEQVIANLAAQDTKGANDRSAIIAKAGQEMAKMIHDSYQNATTSRDHAMEGWSQYMRGVQTFRNPNTGEKVELSNEYGYAWAASDRTYVLTDSANFNPNSSLQGTFTRMEQVPR